MLFAWFMPATLTEMKDYTTSYPAFSLGSTGAACLRGDWRMGTPARPQPTAVFIHTCSQIVQAYSLQGKGVMERAARIELTHQNISLLNMPGSRWFWPREPGVWGAPASGDRLAGRFAHKDPGCKATCFSRGCLADFYRSLCARLDIDPIIETELPNAVSVHQRHNDDQTFVFVMNFSPEPVEVQLDQHTYTDLLAGATVARGLRLEPYGIRVLSKE